MILTCCHLVVLKKFVCYIFQICRSAAMDQKPPVWMKKEETDEVPAEPGSMFPEDPVIIEEPSVGVKQDSELKHVDDSDFNVATSTRYASNSESKRKAQPGLRAVGSSHTDNVKFSDLASLYFTNH
ncbi:uncharacterized protein LOC126108990 isoform X5 [Schistocerca cancellata]|uniref:uncharacterized protein LOC126108990 isoform X5 n=1 Tax=Schistocerca cancellata TaxID=274614 RepID=UPI0021189C18|nr:uncharacterized protein LOC126108990 isoform X5 [Schistocerca cancellata]